jgi:hypothetical protein
MPSSKGKPTDPKLREKVKEDVKNETNKDGGGKGQWSAWKVCRQNILLHRTYVDHLQAAKLSKEYEKKGGSYENSPGSKNVPQKGTPQPKSSDKKKAEEKKDEKEDGEQEDEGNIEKPKANTSKKTKTGGATKKSNRGAAAKKDKAPVEGTRKSARQAEKRKVDDAESDGPKKKSKN